MRDEALCHSAEKTTLFAEVRSQPEGTHYPRLQKTKHVVATWAMDQ